MSRRSIGIALATIALTPAAASAHLHQNLVTPDARDAGQPRVVVQDLVTPDARDAARRVVPIPVASVGTATTSGFSWGDAAIGAGAATGLVLLLMGGRIAVTRRRGLAA